MIVGERADEHPLYSPDLASSGFSLLKFKKELSSKNWANDDDVISLGDIIHWEVASCTSRSRNPSIVVDLGVDYVEK